MRWVLVIAMLAAATSVGADTLPPAVATALTDPTRMPLRVHVARAGAFGLTADTTETDMKPTPDSWFDDVPVVETRPGRVRIVHDEDGARMLLWIDEKDLAWAIAKKTRISGKGDVGVWLLPGARVTASGRGARRTIVARFASTQDVSFTGVVAAGALTRMFAEAPAPTFGEHETSKYAPELRLSPGGRRIGGIPGGLPVVVVAAGRGGWTLVEHRGRWLEVRGWARERDLTTHMGSLMGSGGGSGYGMSHVKAVEVPIGTCLHASEDGPIAGIQTHTIKRYTPDQGDWYSLYVGNAWGMFRVYARVARVDAAGKPTFAPCP